MAAASCRSSHSSVGECPASPTAPRHEEVSSSKGLDVILNQSQIKKLVRALREGGTRVAIFVDPDYVAGSGKSPLLLSDGLSVRTLPFDSTKSQADLTQVVKGISDKTPLFRLPPSTARGLVSP